jgi:hypothetical protein
MPSTRRAGFEKIPFWVKAPTQLRPGSGDGPGPLENPRTTGQGPPPVAHAAIRRPVSAWIRSPLLFKELIRCYDCGLTSGKEVEGVWQLDTSIS